MSFTLAPILARFVREGTPCAGEVEFEPSVPLRDTSTGDIVSGVRTVLLDADGYLGGPEGVELEALDDATTLPAPDDDGNPTAFWKVRLKIQGDRMREYALTVLAADSGAGVQLAARLDGVATRPLYPYVLLPVYAAHAAETIAAGAHGGVDGWSTDGAEVGDVPVYAGDGTVTWEPAGGGGTSTIAGAEDYDNSPPAETGQVIAWGGAAFAPADLADLPVPAPPFGTPTALGTVLAGFASAGDLLDLEQSTSQALGILTGQLVDLSGVTDADTARTNLGLGAAATKNVGTAAGTVAAGDDSRFTDARTPTGHHATHSTGGGDPIAPGDIGAVPSSALGVTVATLDSGGKVPSNQIPAVAITDTFTVASQAAMLALTAQRGDVAIRTDLNDTFILTADDPTLLSNWAELRSPTDGVTAVTGTGNIASTGGTTPQLSFTGTLPVANGGTGVTTAPANQGLFGPASGSAAAPAFRALVAADLPAGTGTVTSVGLSVPGLLYTVSGSPVTGAGTLTFALRTQVANTVLAGPTTGADTAPTMRALVAADLPSISLTTGVSGILPAANGGTGINNGTNTLTVPSTGTANLIDVAQTITALKTIKISDSATNTATVVSVLGHNSSGTPAANYGTALKFQGQSSTTVDRDMAQISALWSTATDANRASAIVLQAVTGGAALAELGRFQFGGLDLVLKTGTAFIVDTGQTATVRLVPSGSDIYFQNTTNAGKIYFTGNSGGMNTGGVVFNSSGDLQLGAAALATSATKGFITIPTCAGTPTGTPTPATGLVPLVFDTTGLKLWIYTGGAWKSVTFA